QSDAEVERPPHVVFGDLSFRSDELKDRRPRPRSVLDVDIQSVGQKPGRVARYATACNMHEGVAEGTGKADGIQVGFVDGQQRFAQRLAAEFGRTVVDAMVGKQHASRERKTVRVQTG